MLASCESLDALTLVSLVVPAASLVLLFVGGFVVYLVVTRLRGTPDREMHSRGSSLILGPFLRDYFAWLMNPLLRFVLASGLPANSITCLALFLATGSGLALGTGHFGLGGWLFLGSGFCDFLDGKVARIKGQVSPAGALLDSVFDRYGEGAVFMGLAWFYHDSWILLIVVMAALGSQFVSYVRARCENEDIDVSRIGVLQRPERVAILGTAICLSPIVEALIAAREPATYHLAITAIAFVAVMSHITAAQRLIVGSRRLRRHETLMAMVDLPRASGRVRSSFLP
jgi:phosphatidylglycerophosphate synthase